MLRFFEKNAMLSWIVTIIIAIAIFYVSSLTFPPSISSSSIKSIFYHFSAFFFFSAFLVLSIIRGDRKEYKLFLFISIIFSLTYALSDEIHQLFVPGRSCSFSDLMIDFSGILFSSLIYTSYIKFRRK